MAAYRLPPTVGQALLHSEPSPQVSPLYFVAFMDDVSPSLPLLFLYWGYNQGLVCAKHTVYHLANIYPQFLKILFRKSSPLR